MQRLGWIKFLQLPLISEHQGQEYAARAYGGQSSIPPMLFSRCCSHPSFGTFPLSLQLLQQTAVQQQPAQCVPNISQLVPNITANNNT